MSRNPLLLLAGLALLAAIVAAQMGRYRIINDQKYTVIVQDRWTGKTRLCDTSRCVTLFPNPDR